MAKEFTKGVNLKTITNQYGDMLQVGINLESFQQNEIKNGWINFSIKKSQNGNWYCENYKPQ